MDFAAYVQEIEGLYLNAAGRFPAVLLPLSELIGFKPSRILVIAPHPDDECLMSGFALRAKQEFGAVVSVLPFSYGSEMSRQEERKRELQAALQVLEFELLDPRPSGFEELGAQDIVLAIQSYRPDVLIIPHAQDGHRTHIRCSETAEGAARVWVRSSGTELRLIQSEYWQAMEAPNLMIPLSTAFVTQMGNGLLKHTGEVRRNPYHLSLPAWLMDSKRRGSECITGMGSQTNVSLVFAQLYRHTLLK